MNTPALDSALYTILVPAFERKATSITAIDVRKLTSYADTIVIIETTSRRQTTSIAEHMVKALKSVEMTCLGKEGIKDGEWALLDFGDVIIHVFESEAKTFFNLEGLWADAPRIDLSEYELKHGRSGKDNG